MARILILFIATLFLFPVLQAQPVRVQVNVIQPVPPYLPQLKADIAGNRAGLLNQDISSHLSIILSYSGRGQQHIKLAGSIERIAPSPIGVSLRPDYQPAQPIIMGPQQPIISLTGSMLQTAFGNFSENSLVYNNTDLNSLRQNSVDYKLPEGTYRVCVTAYDFDKPGFSAPLSAPGTGCAFFTICYTASAPQLILPVSTMLQSNIEFQDLTPHSPQIQFTWTPPATTCGTPLGALNYNLEIRRVFEGQTVTDAQNNPFVFRQQNIPSTTFLLDTLKYAHVLVPGQKYTVRVKANFTPMVGSPLDIANQGYSQVGAFNYQPQGGVPINSVAAVLPGTPDKPIPPGSILPGGYIIESYSPGGACPVATPVTNTTSLSGTITGQDLSIGGFKLHIDQATVNNDGSYKGNGYIVWHPFANDIWLSVGFDTIRVNTDKVVFGGRVLTITDKTHPQWSPFSAIDPVTSLAGLDNTNDQAIRSRISDGVHLINQATGSAEMDFPLGLNTTLGGAPFTLAIMGISFQPGCTNMNVLLNVDLPDLGGSLSLAGTGFQVDPNKVLMQDKGGVLFLPQNRNLTVSGMNFNFDACPGAGSNTIDTSKGTYVQWDGSGLGKIVVNADLQFTNSHSLVAVDKNDNRLTDPATVHARFSFTDWNDWTASVAPTTNFELGSLPGFMISTSGGYYDHSTKQNASSMGAFPAGYSGVTDASWEGLYIQDLTMQLPSSLVGTSAASFGFHNFMLDNTGVSTTISVDNILDIHTGILGGWAFSIDHIGIGVVSDNFQSGMSMTGGIQIPLSTDALAYTCNLSIGEGTGLNYQFSVAPKGNYNVKMWAATIGLQNSSLTITNNSGQFTINARLNGSVSFSTSGLTGGALPDLTISALSFQGMTITNHDPKTGAFGFDPGNWSFAGKGIPGIAKNIEPDLAPGSPLLAGGPREPETGSTQGIDDSLAGDRGDGQQWADGSGSQGSADGFSINITGFKPYVQLSSAEADIGVTFTVNAVLDESGLGIGGAATMDIYGIVKFPKGLVPQVNTTPNINLDSVGIDCNMDLMHITGGLAFKRQDGVFGNDVRGHLDLSFLGTIDVDAAAIFGHTQNFNYWGLAATTFWPQGIMFPPGLSLNGLGGGFHYNMGMGSVSATKVTGPEQVATPEAIINQLKPEAGTLGFDAQAILAYLGPNVICFQPTFSMDFSTSHGLEMIKFDGPAEILSSSPPAEQSGILNATATAVYTTNPQNFNCSLNINGSLPVVKLNVPVQFNVGDGGNYLYVGAPAPPGTDFHDPAINSMATVELGFDASIVHADMEVYGYFDIGTTLPGSPYIPPAIQHANDHDGNSMAQGVIDKFTDMLSSLQNTNDNSHNAHGTVNNPGFMVGAGIHFDAGLDLVVVSADGSLDIGFAALLEHFDPGEIPASCSATGSIGFNNWYAMAIFYANLSADLSVGPFTVGSVNAGAVLSAGLINPTWASGDIYIDVSALGVIDFSGDVSISIGQPCSIVKDPLDNIDMIGDFGPRTKNGAPVDVSSVPYVVGNVPLYKDYPVMVNNGDMRTYQFRIDTYDVTSTNGVSMGVSNRISKNDYEVDVDHNEMFCGNATYNAHIVCNAYQTNSLTPNNPLATQDTSFSFTTGPRPQTIQLDNLIYSYPVPNQRYLLKNEFGSQGTLVVAQDIGYLLTAGKADDCSNPPAPPPPSPSPSTSSSPSGGAPSGGVPSGSANGIAIRRNVNNVGMVAAKTSPYLVTTQLTAKFVPIGGGDTLQTTFSYKYDQTASTGTLQFPLPAGLQNSKSYEMDIWVIPPPPPKNNIGVSTTSQNKTLTETSTVYTKSYQTNANGNVVPVVTASQVTKQMTEVNTGRSLSGFRTMASADTAKNIFSMIFATSQYNAFAAKMAAYGSWSTADETLYNFDMPIFSSATAVEPFDEYEIKDFVSSCNKNNIVHPTIPHLFNADVPWDPNAHNDQDAGMNYVSFTGISILTHATVDLGGPQGMRGFFGVPQNQLVSMENMPYQPKLSIYNNAFERSIVPSMANSGAIVNQPNASGSGNLLYKTAILNNTAYQLPLAGTTTVKTQAAPPGLLWKRDDYFYNDYMLLKDFVGDLSAKSNAITAQTAIDIITYCSSCAVEQASGYYGSVSMTASGWLGVISGDMTGFWQDVNSYLALPFKPFPPTPRRTINFTYNYPCPSCAATPSTTSSFFNYKSSLYIPQAGEKTMIPVAGSGNYTTQGVTTVKPSTPPPVKSVPVKAILLQKYNIH